MTIASRLQTELTNTQTNVSNAVQTYFTGPGKTALEGFLKQNAQKGLNYGYLHIDINNNPSSQNSGVATLSGELGVMVWPPSQTILARNNIGWIYLNAPQLTIAQFQSLVNNFVTDLSATEGLTVNAKIGVDMADLTISW